MLQSPIYLAGVESASCLPVHQHHRRAGCPVGPESGPQPGSVSIMHSLKLTSCSSNQVRDIQQSAQDSGANMQMSPGSANAATARLSWRSRWPCLHRLTALTVNTRITRASKDRCSDVRGRLVRYQRAAVTTISTRHSGLARPAPKVARGGAWPTGI